MLGAALLLATLPAWLAGEFTPQPQSAEDATFCPRIEKEQGHIDWREPAEVIARKVRAYQPWPTAYTTWNGQRLKVLRARAEQGAGSRGTREQEW